MFRKARAFNAIAYYLLTHILSLMDDHINPTPARFNSYLQYAYNNENDNCLASTYKWIAISRIKPYILVCIRW